MMISRGKVESMIQRFGNRGSARICKTEKTMQCMKHYKMYTPVKLYSSGYGFMKSSRWMSVKVA